MPGCLASCLLAVTLCEALLAQCWRQGGNKPMTHAFSIDEGVALLAASPLFAGIDAARLRVLIYAADPVSISAGKFIVRQGSSEPAAWLVLKGEAEGWLDEEPALKLSIGRGALIGEGAMIAGLHHRMHVRATDDMELLRFSRELFQRVCEEFPEVGRTVMANYATRMADIASALKTLLPE